MADVPFSLHEAGKLFYSCRIRPNFHIAVAIFWYCYTCVTETRPPTTIVVPPSHSPRSSTLETMAPASRSEDMYNATGSLVKTSLATTRISHDRGQQKMSTKSNLKHSRSSSIGRSENEPATWSALQSHLSNQRETTRKSNLPGRARNEVDEKAHLKINVVTPLNDLRQFDYSNTRSTPLSFGLAEEGSWNLERKTENSNHRQPVFRNYNFAINASSKAELDEVMVKTDKPLRRQKLKSPVKGSKGALGWLIKPFAKDQNSGDGLSTPGSTLSKPSVKSFESEHVKPNKILKASTSGVVSRRHIYQDTPESQQRRWLLQVHRAIRDGAVMEVVVRSVAQHESYRPTTHPLDEKHTADPKFKTRDSSSESGIFEEPTLLLPENDPEYIYPADAHPPSSSGRKRDYRAYSTFDDEQSVSSIELLFNWLTCRDVQLDGERRNARRHDPRPEGMEFDLETTSTDPYTQKKSAGFCR